MMTDLSASTPTPGIFGSTQQGNSEKRKRSRNWDHREMVLLVQAKKEEWESHENGRNSERFKSSSDKWQRVVQHLIANGISDRDIDQCRGKWDNLLSDYKLIKDWQKAEGTQYLSMSRETKKKNKLPYCFDTELMELLDSFQGKKPTILDNSAPLTPFSQDDVVREEREPASREKDTDSGGKKKKRLSNGRVVHSSQPAVVSSSAVVVHSGTVVQAIRETKDSYVAVLSDMEIKREERFLQNLTLERERLDMERARMEVEREDRKELIGVLGMLAKAFEKIAEKM